MTHVYISTVTHIHMTTHIEIHARVADRCQDLIGLKTLGIWAYV
jgi:hypothetical protein